MKKKKQLPEENDNMNALQDTQIYGAGHEADEKLGEEEDDIKTHTNGGIPDDTGDDSGDGGDDEEDDDDEKSSL